MIIISVAILYTIVQTHIRYVMAIMAAAPARRDLAPQTWVYSIPSADVKSPVDLLAHIPVISLPPSEVFGVAVPQQCALLVHLLDFEHAAPSSPAAGLLSAFQAAIRVAFVAFYWSLLASSQASLSSAVLP